MGFEQDGQQEILVHARECHGGPALATPAAGDGLEGVRVIAYAPAFAIKIVLPRTTIAGDPGDRDVYGAQQHGPLLGVEL